MISEWGHDREISTPRKNLAEIHILDTWNHAIRLYSSGKTFFRCLNYKRDVGFVSNVAGSTQGISGYADGFGTVARFSVPGQAVFSSSSGIFYVADNNNNCIRTVSIGGSLMLICELNICMQRASAHVCILQFHSLRCSNRYRPVSGNIKSWRK